jgi:hypothetical protein
MTSRRHRQPADDRTGRDAHQGYGVTRPDGPTHPSDTHTVMSLQRAAGNAAVVDAVTRGSDALNVQLQTTVRRPRRRAQRQPTQSENNAAIVTAQVGRGRFIEAPQSTEGLVGPPDSGGAFWLLNGLAPEDMADTLRHCGPQVRAQLHAHLGDTVGRFDTPRLTAALRAASWQDRSAGVAGLTLLDSIRNAQNTPPVTFIPVWNRLAGQNRPTVIATLRTLPRDVLTTLQGALGEAPEADRPMLTEVITDLLGTGTNMSANDVIDLEGLRGLDRMMASIYNHRGQLIHEQAAALGINTAAAAGIMKVESGGATFSEATNRTIARFENHHLWSRWGRRSAANRQLFQQHFQFAAGPRPWEGHRFRDGPTDAWRGFHGNQAQEWHVLEFAQRLAGDVAYECASFGAGQIMGFNHGLVGFASAREMVESYNRSERSQITGIFEFIRANRLAAAVNANDYEQVARRYNGPGQAQAYGANIRTAAQAYARVTAGKQHVIP